MTIAAATTAFCLSGLFLCNGLRLNFSSIARPTMALTPIKKIAFSDTLFEHIEEIQGDRPWGRLLDAGTGLHSLRWISTLLHEGSTVTSWSAVTADEGMRKSVQSEARGLGMLSDEGSIGTVLIGNWQDEMTVLCEDELFDTIIVDYLVGSIDGFAPYYQDLIFPRIVRHLSPGGRIYVVGLQPIPDKVGNGDDPKAQLVCEVRKVRDACILLGGHRCYREFPADWINRHLARAELEVIETKKFPILYSHSAIVRQINVGRSKLSLFPNKELAESMRITLDKLETESKEATASAERGRLKLGFDYIVAAELVA
uniref:Methyltransferase type 11 domain-containing protein n=1 Tax=Corethron hystrix TaxID=216773 RepID=A0A6U5KST7_9STRA|mmetsp:Transcript_41882/g.98161  ORF Transcript_41882/g.98161 Transcript_41882/m.98161 type:complete len:313 (+) Transcript_41882:208-1146(+)